jgi:hypothetical protein
VLRGSGDVFDSSAGNGAAVAGGKADGVTGGGAGSDRVGEYRMHCAFGGGEWGACGALAGVDRVVGILLPLPLAGEGWGEGVAFISAKPESSVYNLAGGCPAASYFLLLAQKKVTKQKDTPHHAPSEFLALLAKPGGCGTRATRSDSPRRNLPSWLCCSAWRKGSGQLVKLG